MNTLASEYTDYFSRKISYSYQMQMFSRTMRNMCNFMNTVVDGRVLGLFSSDIALSVVLHELVRLTYNVQTYKKIELLVSVNEKEKPFLIS